MCLFVLCRNCHINSVQIYKNNVLQFKIHLCNVYVYNLIYIVVESVYTSILTYIYRGKTCVWDIFYEICSVAFFCLRKCLFALCCNCYIASVHMNKEVDIFCS